MPLHKEGIYLKITELDNIHYFWLLAPKVMNKFNELSKKGGENNG